MKHEILLSAPEIIKGFLIYSETIKNKSANSVNEYYTDLRTFFRYILMIRGLSPIGVDFKEIDISSVDLELVKTITLQDLYAFLVFCKNDLNNSANTRARKCSVLKIYFKYLALNTKQINSNPAELLEAPKTTRSLPKHLTLEDSIELLKSIGLAVPKPMELAVSLKESGIDLKETPLTAEDFVKIFKEFVNNRG